MPAKTYTEAERQERREADRRRTREAVEALRASEGWQNWLRLRHYFHDFSLSNQLLIAVSMPEATRVAGFRTWLKLGYCVRRGERARIRIWIPMAPSKKRLAEWEAAGAKPADRPRVWFRLGPVWDRSQVEPLPPPAMPVSLDPPIAALEGDSLAWVFPRLVALTSELGCSLVIERHPDGRGGCFMPELRIISLNEKCSVNHRVKTFVHELAHALLRHTAEVDEITLTYSQEELVVESIALSVVAGLGIDSSGYSIPYIASWSENEASLEIVETCAGLIHRLAKRIEDAVHRAPQTETAEQTAA
jgi:antirestriction protein ArdC